MREEIKGYIERITYQNPNNGYMVAKLKMPKVFDTVTVVGMLPSVRPGESLHLFGSWKHHLVHGRQFEVAEHRVDLPADINGIKKYLGSGFIKGIGPAYAKKIVAKFGTDTLEVISSTPNKLLEVEGLGAKRLEKIKACWDAQKTIREVMVFLQTFGVTPAYAQKIFKTYGENSIEIVRDNPYRLARDIFGIGFKTADSIALKLGIEPKSAIRISAGIEYLLNEYTGEGHVCYPLSKFLQKAAEALDVPYEAIKAELPLLIEERRIEMRELCYEGTLESFLWLKPLFLAEVGIAHELARLLLAPSTLRSVDVGKALEWVQKKLGIELAKKQEQAVASALEDKVHIITGGPGTGKSTITNAILTIVEKLTGNITLAAPTGRAAKRMAEITGRTAKTIHSLLEFNPGKGGFKRNRDNPLMSDLLIVDEASMIDTVLMFQLLRAVPTHCRVLFVGDIHQLPSVGPGNVLKDLIESRKIGVTTLTEIFRQAAGSRIITNAHYINAGTFPDIRNLAESDFYFIEAQEKEDVQHEIVRLVAKRLPMKYGFCPFRDIQVLSPMKRGAIGTETFNYILQKELNQSKESVHRFGREYKIGDKVMQIRNNYDKEVFNGDIGRIERINVADQEVFVAIDDRHVSYEFSDLDELTLAYAVSIHKYQGSECPCVVIPLSCAHYIMLSRNLLYTGVTRGKKLVVIVGSKKALAIAVGNNKILERYAALSFALDGLL